MIVNRRISSSDGKHTHWDHGKHQNGRGTRKRKLMDPVKEAHEWKSLTCDLFIWQEKSTTNRWGNWYHMTNTYFACGRVQIPLKPDLYRGSRVVNMGRKLPPTFQSTLYKWIHGARGRVVKALDLRFGCLGFDFRNACHVYKPCASFESTLPLATQQAPGGTKNGTVWMYSQRVLKLWNSEF